jgi:3-dehydroquinate synthase
VTTIQVLLGDRSYPIRIRPNALGELGPAIAGELEASHVVVITTPRVGAAHFAGLEAGIRGAGLRSDRVEVPEGERAKTLRTASRVYDALIELGADRKAVIVGFGGGATGDLAGFVASTYLRGLSLVQAPTTLLAQVDASVGGKTGINHRRGKNLIGTFYQPRLVWVDPALLRTLPARERRSGMAEVVKVAAIWDAELFARLERDLRAILRLESEPLAEAVARAIAIKAEIVGLDEREEGLRSLLNFGHTLGHAIENVGSYRRHTHGEAVAIGMVFAARLSEARGICAPGCAARLESLLARIGLPTELPDWKAEREAYLRALSVDKKTRGAQVGFVALRDVGRAEVVRLTPEEILREAP